MEIDAALLRRATPLVFGIFAHAPDENAGQRILRVGGSGIFVGPFLPITARHVSRDLFRLDPRADRPPRGYVETRYSSGLFQVRQPSGGPQALWAVDRTWDSLVTDLSLMQVSLEPGYDKSLESQMPTRFFEWSLLPPSIGETVDLLGFPQTNIAAGENEIRIDLTYVHQRGTVVAVHREWRDRGMLTFPCFEVDRPVDHGFSGGPVFHQGRLCGLVSAGSAEGHTIVASLWPLSLMQYEYPGLGGATTFGDLFTRGVIVAHDWREVRSCIGMRYDDLGQPYAYLDGGPAT